MAVPEGWCVRGQADVLDRPLLGLVSSVQCPGSIIVQLLHAMRALRAAGIGVIGGFHSPIERECLELLLNGTQPVVLCQARPSNRLGPSVRRALDAGRLAILSPKSAPPGRLTRDQATARNELVAHIATALFVPYAATGGATEALALRTLATGKPVLALDGPANAPLGAFGCHLVDADSLATAALQSKWSTPERSQS